MIKRLNLILNGKGGVGKKSNCLLLHLVQPLKTAVGRLVLCKPFLATAAVWLDSGARYCGLRLRFCVRKTCPATGTKQLSISLTTMENYLAPVRARCVPLPMKGTRIIPPKKPKRNQSSKFASSNPRCRDLRSASDDWKPTSRIHKSVRPNWRPRLGAFRERGSVSSSGRPSVGN